MEGREKPEQSLGSIGLIQSLKEDMLSQLPDPLICHILSHLPLKDAVKTSVLFTRWRSLWLWVPCLELKSHVFSDLSAFMSFGDRFFDSSRVSYIHKLNLGVSLDDDEDEDEYVDNVIYDASYLMTWIDASVKRKIQHLLIRCPLRSYCKMPLRLFTCETLVSLKLYGVYVENAEFVSLPCLKTMHLCYNMYPNDATFERLVSGCLVLEKLKMTTDKDDATIFRVHSQSLKKLTLSRYIPFGFIAGVVIDAPLLCCLSISDIESEIFLVNNLDSNTKLDISLFLVDPDIAESKRSTILNLLPCISRVRDVTIRYDTFKILCEFSKLEPLPQFGYMSCLSITLDAFSLNWLPIFLRSCPNLKSLILGSIRGFRPYRRMGPVSFSSVPECLLSSLEFVEFKAPISGCALEMKLVRYFLKNSAILKKLSLRLRNHSKRDEIFEIPRGSTECEVVIFEIPIDSIECGFVNL